MKMKSILAGLALALFPLTAVAGAGHNHSHGHDPVSAEKAAAIATQRVEHLAANGKIDASWKGIKAETPEQKRFGGNLEWVVSFKNEAVKEPAKRTLYLFLTLEGEYLAANYTGE